MAMKLPTRPTQGPMRGLPLTTGSLPAAAFLILARPDGDSASPARSGTTLERSRIWPSASRIPGFSRPGALGQQVLVRYVAGVDRATGRAGGREFLRLAGGFGRHARDALRGRLVD